jgi:RNA 2',3'-cyclic 3'-phosphodiesterase
MPDDQTGFDLGNAETSPRRQAGRLMGDDLFIAARPDRTAAEAAQAIARDYRDLYRIDRQPLTDRRLHVGLIGIDRAPLLDKSLIYDARAAIDSILFEPFEISFDSVVSFRSGASRPVVLAASKPNPALRTLLFRLADRLDGLGIPFGFDPDFLMHMTLLHYDKPVMPEHLSRPISWMIDRLWLIRSLGDRGGHEFLWPPENRPDA